VFFGIINDELVIFYKNEQNSSDILSGKQHSTKEVKKHFFHKTFP
tara:strand:+ start:15757 stop:15891 length:135 start_codon:yes stop_codon:yes gene_type:complete